MTHVLSSEDFTPTPEYPLCPLLSQYNHIVLCQKDLCMWYTDDDECGVISRPNYRLPYGPNR